MNLQPTLKEFEKRLEKTGKEHIWAEVSADLITPVAAMMKLKSKYDYCFLLESVEGGANRGRYSIIGLGAKFTWELKDAAKNPNALDELKKIIRENEIKTEGLPPMASGLFGYLGYDTVRLFENIPNKNKDELGIPDAILFYPEIVLIFDSVKDKLFIIVPVLEKGNGKMIYEDAENKIRMLLARLEGANAKAENAGEHKVNFKSSHTREQYHAMVNKAKEYIAAGDIFQLVPSQRFVSDFKLKPFSFYRSLRQLNPSPFLFYLQLKDFSIIGSSPEILVRLRDDVVTIRPIAGTRKRGKDAAEDKELAADLLSDQKELAEHLMLLDLGRNDVGRVAAGGKVRVTEKMIIEYYSHVMHIVSNVEGDIAKGKDAVDALAAGFPAGTVSGAPKIRAMEIIDELEKTKRKFYGGAVGYFAGNQMDTCIALRTALIKDKKIYLQAGGGVVADSDPEAEYQETINKAKALMRAAELAKDFS